MFVEKNYYYDSLGLHYTFKSFEAGIADAIANLKLIKNIAQHIKNRPVGVDTG